MAEADTLSKILREFGRALGPLADKLATPEETLDLLRTLGLAVDIVPPSVTALRPYVKTLVDKATAFDDLIGGGQGQLIAAAVQLGDAVAALTAKLIEFGPDLANDLEAMPELLANVDAAEVGRRLLDLLVVTYLRHNHDVSFHVLVLLGVIEQVPMTGEVPALFTTPDEPSPIDLLGVCSVINEDDEEQDGPPEIVWTLTVVHWERIVVLFEDPAQVLSDVYGWNTGDFDRQRLLQHLMNLCGAFGLRVVRTAFGGGNELSDELRLTFWQQTGSAGDIDVGLYLGIIPATDYRFEGVEFSPFVHGKTDTTLQLTQHVSMQITASSDLSGLPHIELHPPLDFSVGVGAPTDQLNVRYTLKLRNEENGYELFQVPGLCSLRTDGFDVVAELMVAPNSVDPAFSVAIVGGTFELDTTEGDSFLSEVFAFRIRTNFDLAARWSPGEGLVLGGSADLSLAIPLSLEIGPVKLQEIQFGYSDAEPEGTNIEATVTASADFGPVTVSVERFGVRVRVVMREEGGNLGPIHVDRPEFRPPNGLGLAIDAGPVSGGGFISFDEKKGQYAGLLELEMFGVGVTAIGLLATKGSNGQALPPPGFSLLMIISTEFPALQLGFGFTLNGVGGLVGIHRMMMLDELRNGVRAGSLDNIMFPQDPVHNMHQIISDLRGFFPPANDRYVFGPMAKLNWGTPTLFEAELGILLEVDSPVILALIGQVNVALPSEETNIVSLHVSILGVLDTNKKMLSIDASLYDSHIASFAVYGDMAMRLAWGAQPSFALAIGGLNPHFQPPPQFPTMRRVTVSLGLGDNPRISLQAYAAITSNSIQFGAAAELYAAVGEFNVYGWLRFDALVVFSPFHFRFDYTTGFALRLDDNAIAGISISGMLSGPSPYHVIAKGCISVLFFDICVTVDVTVGERKHIELPAKDPWLPLVEAIEDPRNWSPTLAPGVRTAVTFKEQQHSRSLFLVHPMGTVTLRQKILPLNSRLDKFGEFDIVGAHRYELQGVLLGTEPVEYEVVEDFFAPGQYETLSNSEKLSQKSFDLMPAGISVGSNRARYGNIDSMRVRDLIYKTSIIDDYRVPGRSVNKPALSRDTQVALSEQGAKAFSKLSRSGSQKYKEASKKKPFTYNDEDYAIASKEDMGLHLEFGTGLSKAIAHQILKDHLDAHPEDIGRLQVVPLAELEDVA